MKTKVTMKDAVVIEYIQDAAEDYWDYCDTCTADKTVLGCADCQPRVLPPTRWRKGKA